MTTASRSVIYRRSLSSYRLTLLLAVGLIVCFNGVACQQTSTADSIATQAETSADQSTAVATTLPSTSLTQTSTQSSTVFPSPTSTQSSTPFTAPSSSSQPTTAASQLYCNETVTKECYRKLDFNGTLECRDYTAECPQTSLPQRCSATLETSNSSVAFGLLCTTNGLKIYKYNSSDNRCVATLNATMSILCGTKSKLSCNIDQHCLYSLNSSSVTSVIQKAYNCTNQTTSGGLKLLPNPVGPEAITAIVVLVCLTIIAILAGFFFWPKCHIADPAAHAIKKVMKPASAARAAATAGQSSTADGASGGVKYDGGKKTATITLPAVPGPSAA